MTITKKLDSDPKLQSVVVNPALSHREKLDVVQLLTQTGGGSAEASKAVKNLLEVMSENSRLGHLNGVVNAFEKIMRAHKGEVDVVVTSSQVRSQVRVMLMLAVGFSCLEPFGTIYCEIVSGHQGSKS